MKSQFKRRLIRERVLQILYAYEMNTEGLQALIDSVLNDIHKDEDRVFADLLVHKVLVKKKELDEIIEERISNWEMDRITLIDKILIRMAICELKYFEDIPPKVSINESIEIAKEYSTAGSGKFINGILDAVYEDLKNKGILNKTGRGLIDETIKPAKK
ncbi:MAG: transcription antitermination factor NusB [Bacteroidota bacterium]|nr:transcription antitermination factor NusB [Bacteroidota bacterium]